jgi:hypothetical protein
MPLPTAVLAAPAIGSAVSSIAGAAGSAKGNKREPAGTVSPDALAALRAGTAGANASLAGLPVPSGQNVIDVYADIAKKLAGLSAPEPTINADAMTQDIANTTAAALAPQRAQTAREFREAAGAFGPSTALNSARGGQVAEEANMMARLIAETKPKLSSQEFEQNLAKIQAALGITQAQGNAATTPVDLLQRLRQGNTGQLLGAGSPAASTMPGRDTVPAWSTALLTTGETLGRLPGATENIWGNSKGPAASGGTPSTMPGIASTPQYQPLADYLREIQGK